MKFSLLTILLFICIPIAYPQVPSSIHFEQVEVEHNPTIQYITTINNDHTGNIWFASYRGLFKYDGYRFTLYVNDPNDGNTLVNNKVYNTYLSQDKSLWVCASFGIQKYDPIKDIFINKLTEYTSNAKLIYETSFSDLEDIDKNYMLIGTKKGILIYNKNTDQVVATDTLDATSYADSKAFTTHVLEIEPDNVNDNILWIYTRLGLYKFYKEERKTEKIAGPFNSKFFDNSERGYSIQVIGNEIILQSVFKELFSFNKVTKKWIHLNAKSKLSNNQSYIRNVLKVSDDYALIFYINKTPSVYKANNGKIEDLPTTFEQGLKENTFSYSSIDPNGYLISINGNNRLVKSKEKLIPIQRNYQILRSNIQVNNLPFKDTMRLRDNIFLADYQRNIKFKLGLNNISKEYKPVLYYSFDQKKWTKLKDNRLVELNNLSAGFHKVFARAVFDETSIEAKIIQFQIKPYFYESWWFRSLLALLAGGICFGFYYQNRKRKKDKEAFNKQLLELQMNSLRSQMNPHFLFNSLNSIKNYMVSKGTDEAADYITKFSLLIRKILEQSRKAFLTLDEEIEMLKLYVEMEKKRFNGKFNYSFIVDKEIDKSLFQVAPMLIQPFIENAIWHGLMNKEDQRHLEIKFVATAKGIHCIVKDNGIGRLATQKINAERGSNKKSLGLEITSDRLKTINKMYGINAQVDVRDLYNAQGESLGTEVKIFLPEIQTKK